MIISDAITARDLPAECGQVKEAVAMPRIGTVIRDVYRRSGAEALPAHLENRYAINVDKVTKLAPGVYRVDRCAGRQPDRRARRECQRSERPRTRSEPGPRATRVIRAI